MKTVYTSAFKAQVVLELLKEEQSLSQLAGEYKTHPNVLREWRTAAVSNLASLFERGDDVAKLRTNYEQQLDELYGQIGRLTTQLAWIKKTVGAIVTYQTGGPPSEPPDQQDRRRADGAPDTA